MPSAQVINFGEDPYANAIGGFTKNFLNTINDKSNQRRNDDLFKKIAENYGPDADPDDIFRDVLKSEGFDQDYKREKLKDLKEYAQLASKSKLNGYEAAKLVLRENELDVRKTTNTIAQERLDNEKTKASTTADKVKKDLPKVIANYSAKLLKDAGETLDVDSKAGLDTLTRQFVEAGAPMDEAFTNAYQLVKQRESVIKEAVVTKDPGGFFSATGDENQRKQAKDKAVEDILKIYDEYGITSQKHLKDILKRSGWDNTQSLEILQKAFQQKDRKVRQPSKSVAEASKVLFEE